MTTPKTDKFDIEILAEMMHEWYLEATKKLHPESYNPKAQKQYKDLTEEQKGIDRYISKKVCKLMEVKVIAERERIIKILNGLKKEKNLMRHQLDFALDGGNPISEMKELLKEWDTKEWAKCETCGNNVIIVCEKEWNALRRGEEVRK